MKGKPFKFRTKSPKFVRISLLFVILIFVFAFSSCKANTLWDSTYFTNITTEPSTTLSETFDGIGLTQEEVYDHFKRTVFKIETEDKNNQVMKEGSAFILKTDGTFVTNAHLIKDAWSAQGTFDGVSSVFSVEAIYFYDEQTDLAVGKLSLPSGFTVNPAEFTEDYNQDDKVYSIGYPNDAKSGVVSQGNILSISFYLGLNGKYYIRTDSYLDHGSSGGILSTADGKVIGITTVSFLDGTFGSVMATNFSNWQVQTPDTIMTLSDFFHPRETIRLKTDNFEDYFDVDFDKTMYSVDDVSNNLNIDLFVEIHPDGDMEISDNYNNIYVSLKVIAAYKYSSEINQSVKIGFKEINIDLSLSRYTLSGDFRDQVTIALPADSSVIQVTYTFEPTYISGSIIYYQ